jgi:hypothetical protein
MSFLRKFSKADYDSNCIAIDNQLLIKDEIDNNNNNNNDNNNNNNINNVIDDNNKFSQLIENEEEDEEDDDDNYDKNKYINIQKQEQQELKNLQELQLKEFQLKQQSNEKKIAGDELTKLSQKMTHISNYVKNNQKLNYPIEIDEYLIRIGYHNYNDKDSMNNIKRKALIVASYVYGNASILNKWENSDDNNILNKIQSLDKRLDRLISLD